MPRTLVTGASGFIGGHLVRRLHEDGNRISCLVRPTSDRSRLTRFDPEFLFGDITDPDAVRQAVANADVVYHLAGATKGLRKQDLKRVNVDGTRQVAQACAARDNPPTLILVSSLAAAGPMVASRLRTESDPPAPISNYGRSKLAGEQEVKRFADRVPCTIIRPPIVLGEADRDGLALFDSIARWHIHLVAGMSDELFSVIHGEDLAQALVLAAENGKRIAPDDSSKGIYFATSGEPPTYAQLGKMIGQVMGRDRVYVIRNPKAAVWMIAGINELVSQIRGRPHILGVDKAREAAAGSWACDSAALHRDTGFVPACSLKERLAQTVQWYVDQGWLKKTDVPAFAQ